MRLNCLSVLGSISIACAAANAAPPFVTPDSRSLQSLTPAQAQVQAEAMTAFHERRYPAAFGRFAQLADAGHVPSAEVALVMFRHGSTLFGSDWTASAPQVAKWQALVINNARTHVLSFSEAKGE